MTNPIIPSSPSKADYTSDPAYLALSEKNAAPLEDVSDPIALFADWMAQARMAELNDSNAMAVATADASGLPDVRMILLKGFDARGFVFYTHDHSVKGSQLAANPNAALCFHWKSLRRQVRVRGPVVQVTIAEVDAYFASRARGSQIGAWASEQSQIASSRAALEDKVAQMTKRFEGKAVPRPPNWSGWRVLPQKIEFWRDRPYRLHDRLEFSKTDSGWDRRRLYP
jgi:pyridoxamine 5'-phosphate oxidase